jgi:hypothetical protein
MPYDEAWERARIMPAAVIDAALRLRLDDLRRHSN